MKTTSPCHSEATPSEAPHTTLPLAIMRRALVSMLFAVLLEAGTLFGCFCWSVLDTSAWMPKRMLVFFVLSFVICTVFSYGTRGHSPRCAWHAVTSATLKGIARKAIPVLVSTCLGCAIGACYANLAGDMGDYRYAIAFGCMTFSISVLVMLRRIVCRSLEWGFLILALCFGTLFCILMPTAAEITWDGQYHFNYANAISYIFDPEYTGADVLMTAAGHKVGALFLTGNEDRAETFDVELETRTVDYPHADLEDDSVLASNDVFRSTEEDTEIVRLLNTSIYPSGTYANTTSVGRIPNAVGLWLGRLLHFDCIGRYLLARLCNTWFYALVFFFAIRALRNGKAIMAVIGLCPTSLLEAAGFSHDPWSVSLLALSIGMFVGGLQRSGELSPKDTLKYLVPFVLGGLVRSVVFPLAIVFTLAPKKRFASTKAWVHHLLLIALAVGLLLLSYAVPYLLSLVQGSNQGDSRGGVSVSGGSQIAYVLAHPLRTLTMGLGFALRMLNPLNLGFTLDASNENLMCYAPYLVPSDAPLTAILAPMEFGLLVFVSVVDGGEEDTAFASARYKLRSLISVGLAFACICGSMYVSFTEVGRNTIAGVQQRYLLSLLPTFCLFTLNTGMRRKTRRHWIPPVLMIVEVALLSLVTWNSFVRAF